MAARRSSRVASFQSRGKHPSANTVDNGRSVQSLVPNARVHPHNVK